MMQNGTITVATTPACGIIHKPAPRYSQLHVDSPIQPQVLSKTPLHQRSVCSIQPSSLRRRHTAIRLLRAQHMPAAARGVAASSASGTRTVLVPVGNGSEEIEAVGTSADEWDAIRRHIKGSQVADHDLV
jgi:hypothetical protein